MPIAKRKMNGTFQTISTTFPIKIAGEPFIPAKNIQYSANMSQIKNKTAYTATTASLTVAKTGIYKCSWVHYSSASSASYYLSQLYVNGSAVGSAHQSPAYSGTSGWIAEENNVSLTEGQTVVVYARTRSGSSYYTVAGMLIIEEL